MAKIQSESLTASELTRDTMLSDLRQQPLVLAGAGLAVVALALFWLRRGPSQQRAARHLVRDWRDVDDFSDAGHLLSANVPVILQPAMLALLAEARVQVHRWFRQLERTIKKL